MDIGLADFGVGFVYGIVYKGGNKVYLNSLVLMIRSSMYCSWKYNSENLK